MSSNLSGSSKSVSAMMPGYVPGLDGLRFFAFACVLFWHVTRATGWFGVDLFFVLSGFLITRILISSRDHPRFFKLFYTRRALRIFPLYLFFIVIRSPFIEPGAAVWFYTYTSNFLTMVEQRWIQPGHLWSLATEEQFYLLWPLLIFFIPTRHRFLVVVGMALIPWALRVAGFFSGISPLSLYVAPWFRFDSFAWGGLLAILVSEAPSLYRRIVRWRGLLWLIGLAIALGGVGVHPFEVRFWYWPVIGFTTVSFLSVLVLIEVFESKRCARLLEWSPIRHLGRISYGLYVWHLLALDAARICAVMFTEYFTIERGQIVLEVWYGAIFSLALLISVILAELSWHLLEQPFLRLKRYFEY